MEIRATLDSVTWNRREGHYNVTFTAKQVPEQLETLTGDLDVEVKKHREKRSKDANAMWWACVGELAKALRASKDEVYQMLLKRYGVYEPFKVTLPVLEHLQKQFNYIDVRAQYKDFDSDEDVFVILAFWGTHTYNTAEFSALLDGTISEMKGIGLAPPASEEMRRALDKWEAEHGEHRTDG